MKALGLEEEGELLILVTLLARRQIPKEESMLTTTSRQLRCMYVVVDT